MPTRHTASVFVGAHEVDTVSGMSSSTSPRPEPLVDTGLRTEPDRGWVREAIRKLRADATRTSDTHLVKVHLPGCGRVDLYLKDE